LNFLYLIIFIWLAVLSILLVIVARNKAIYFKKLKTSNNLRVKRYIIIEIIGNIENLGEKILEENIRNAVKELGGKVWLEIANPRVVFIHGNFGIISSTRAGYKLVLASLPYVKSINGVEVLLAPKRTTGSLKRAKKLIGI